MLFGELFFLCAFLLAQAAAVSREEKIWLDYVNTFLSENYIEDHFQLDGVYRSPSGQATLYYVIRYGDVVAHSRTSTHANGRIISGITRISATGEVVSYFGPRKEYILKIAPEKADSIMRKGGCSLSPKGSESIEDPTAARSESTLRLFIGDYWEKTGKYVPDHIPEGFYWAGGRPRKGEKGTECIVDAETGDFKLQRAHPW